MAKQRVTIKDIAAEAGVSVTLVSFVMSNKASGKDTYRVNKETAKRVLEVAERLNYKPNTTARALRSGKTNTIGVIFTDISNMFYANIARNIEDYAYTRDYTVLFGSTDEKPRKLTNLVNTFIDKGVDGLIIVPCDGADETIRQVVEKEIPVVLLDREVAGDIFNSVTLDNLEAGMQAMDALIKQGCKKIDIVSYRTTNTNMIDREVGCQKAMERAGLAGNSHIHRIDFGKLEQIEDVVKSIRANKADGVVFINNTLSILGVKEIVKNGLSIPNDLRLSTFDYVEALVLKNIEIAFIRQPIEQFAIKAMDMIIGLINEDDKFEEPTRVVLAPELVISSAQDNK